MKKLFAIILSLLLIVTTLPLVYAETTEGTFGENHTWAYDSETKTLTISGEGDMGNFWNMYNPPWDAFEGQMTTLVIEDGVTNVGSYLFNNSNLEKVVIGNDVKTIGDSAFRSSSYLKDVELGENVETIGDSAFVGCGSLTEITLNQNLKTIGKRAFVNTKLQAVDIPDSVTKISEGAFYNVPLKTVKIGNGVKTIEKDTFNYCADIEVLEIGNSVEIIGEAAFNNCSSLETVFLPESVKTIEKEAFRECKKLTDIVFPDNVESIGQGAFSDCHSFVNLKIGNGVESLDMSAFNGCTSLETVEIPASVEIIGERAFSACDSLKEFIVANESEHYESIDGVLYTKGKTELLRYPNGKEDVVFEIPNGVKTIGADAFSNSSIKRVVIPNTVSSIYGSAFAYNKSLDYVVIPESVTYMNGAAFSNCMSLTNITIPKGIKRIYAYTFTGCYNLETVNYTGTEAQWNNINIEHSNGPLYDATINFNSKTHTHDYATEILKYSSCTENGKGLYKCACGDVFSVEIPAHGHEFGDWVITNMPTADTEGEKARTCEVCDETEKVAVNKFPENPAYPGEIMCDLNGDRQITAIDARCTLQIAAGKGGFTNIQVSNSDANEDGKVTTIDARIILQIAAGKKVLENFVGKPDDGNDSTDNETPSPEVDTPTTQHTKESVAKALNEATTKAAKASYKFERTAKFTKNVDVGSMTNTLESIIKGVDENASLNSVVGGFLGVQEEPIMGEVKSGNGESAHVKYMLKAMTLTSEDVQSFTVDGNKYQVQIKNCANPDGNSSWGHASDDYVTVAEVNESMASVGETSIKLDEKSSTLTYKDIVITAVIENGNLTSLEYKYTLDAAIKLKITAVSVNGTGAAEMSAKYTDFQY